MKVLGSDFQFLITDVLLPQTECFLRWKLLESFQICFYSIFHSFGSSIIWNIYLTLLFCFRKEKDRKTNVEPEKGFFLPFFLFHAWTNLKIWPWIWEEICVVFMFYSRKKFLFFSFLEKRGRQKFWLGKICCFPGCVICGGREGGSHYRERVFYARREWRWVLKNSCPFEFQKKFLTLPLQLKRVELYL